MTLFTLPEAGQLDSRSYGYDAMPDGSRFLLVTPISRPDAQPVHVIVNWFEQLNAKLTPWLHGDWTAAPGVIACAMQC